MTLRIAESAQNHLDAVTHPRFECPKSSDPSEQMQIEEERAAALEQAENDVGYTIKLIEIGEAATFEGLEKELAVGERLDLAITRCLKQFLWVRGIKSMPAVSSSVSPKRVTGPSRAA